MRNYILKAFAGLLLMLPMRLLATGDSLNILTYTDSLMIQNDSIIGKYFIHTVMPKQTLYSLCRFYGIKTEDMQEINPALKVRTLHIGEHLRVPISEKLIRSTTLPKDRQSFAPVFYEVQKGEGLYRIAKNYFSLKPEQIQELNQLESTNIHLGQKLLLGWIPLNVFNQPKPPKFDAKDGKMSLEDKNNTSGDASKAADNLDRTIIDEAVKSSVENAKKEDAAATAGGLKDKYTDLASKRTVLNDQGAAFWHKELEGSKGLYVLHRTAAPNTVVKVTNPMFQNTVYAKVLGNIPKDTYPDEVMIVVSPDVAKKLGAKDSRFFCKISFFNK